MPLWGGPQSLTPSKSLPLQSLSAYLTTLPSFPAPTGPMSLPLLHFCPYP